MDEKETGFYTTVLIVAGVLGVFIIYFIISIIIQQRRAARLYLKSLLTEITTLEKERSRIAIDLHDELGPILSAVKLRLGSIDVADEEDQIEFEKASGQLDIIIQRLREISFDLLPHALVTKGLPTALQQYIDYCNKGSALRIEFLHDDIAFQEEQALHLYRIIQEIINNTIKHAGASRLTIEIKKTNKSFSVKTTDNGKGFDYDKKAKEASGLGLHNLLSRIELIGGRMFVESQKHAGTSFTFEAPISNNDRIDKTTAG